MGTHPWFKFFPTDWRADSQLRMCSLAARGLWIELLGIMHEAGERGLLLVNGNPVTTKQVAVIVGCTEAEASHHLQELEAAGVFSRKKNGVIYSRRMERDENLSRKNRENGKKGGLASLGKDKGNGASLERKTKPQKPEARIQKPEPPDPPAGDRPPRKRATRVDGFEPDIEAGVAVGLRPEHARAEAEKFLDHFRAKAGGDGSKLDWPATWRNWCRRALERSGPAPPARRTNTSFADRIDAAFDERMQGGGGRFGDIARRRRRELDDGEANTTTIEHERIE